MYLPKTFFLVIFLFAGSGCSQRTEIVIPEHIKDLNNLTVYPADAKPAVTIRFIEEYTFGDTEEAIIGSAGDIAVDKAGRIYIEDPTRGHEAIYVFQPNGDFLTSIGREGKGPGEFYYISAIQVQSNHLFVFDLGQQSIHVFSLDWNLQQRFPLDQTILFSRESWSDIEELKMYSAPNTGYVRSDGKIIGGFIDIEQDEDSLSNRKIHFYLFDENGKLYRSAGKLFEQRATGYLNIHPTVYLFPFLRKSLRTVSTTDSIYSAWTEDFLIKVYSPDGVYQRAIYYPVKKRSLARDDILLKKYLREKEETALSNRRLMAGHRDRIRILSEVMPDTWPALENLLIDDQDRLWVSTITDENDTYDWWVLQNSGELITKFTWPRNRQIEAVKNGKIYTRETDPETGLQQVVRYGFELEER